MTETESSPLPTPDWVLLGFQVPGGVCVYASRKLNRAEVKAEIVEPEILPFQGGICISQARVAYVTLSVEMPEYAMATGADYAEAMRHLMDVWQPPQRTIRLEVTKAAMIPLDDQGRPSGEPRPLPLAGPVDITLAEPPTDAEHCMAIAIFNAGGPLSISVARQAIEWAGGVLALGNLSRGVPAVREIAERFVALVLRGDQG